MPVRPASDFLALPIRLPAAVERNDIIMTDIAIAPSGSADAAQAIADALTERGYDVRDPCQPGSSFLQFTNVRGTMCELTVYDSGAFDWEYRCLDPSRSAPAALAAMALCILSGDAAPVAGAQVACDPRMPLKGQAGRALAGQGMCVRLDVLDEDEQYFEVYAEISVTSPEHPGRGTVRITDDGLLCWRGQLRNPEHPDADLDLDQLTDTLARTLAT
jgi:hypothetical protein